MPAKTREHKYAYPGRNMGLLVWHDSIIRTKQNNCYHCFSKITQRISLKYLIFFYDYEDEDEAYDAAEDYWNDNY